MKATNPMSILQEIFFSTEICFQENPARKNKIGIGENYMEKCLGVSKQLLLLLADLHHGAGPGECFAKELLHD